MTDAPEKGADFDRRLAEARQRQGLEKPAEPGPVAKTSLLGIGMRVGVDMASALAVGAFLGYWLDRVLHTKPFLMVVFLLLGGVAGVRNVWRLVGPKRPGHQE
ncbi:MAG: AtpZ/AtpI family protein [Rhodospirillales bacterium]|nr:AtpZ/AtpI family protein [Rhodospirillales bacterium]